MTSTKPRPLDVVLDKPNRWLRITWNDGHESLYPFAELRYHCPCASCQKQSEEADPVQIQRLEIGDPDMLVEVILAGTYALQFIWGDGHGAGFYAFDYLRDLCRCEICLAGRPQASGR